MLDFSRLAGALLEGRQSPRHLWQKVFDAVFLAAAKQMPHLLRIEAECRSGALATRIGPFSAAPHGYALQRQSPAPVFTFGCEVARRLKRNGIPRPEWSRGRMVAAVAGIEIRGSFARCCDARVRRELLRRVRGGTHADILYYYRIVAVVTARTPAPIPLGIRF